MHKDVVRILNLNSKPGLEDNELWKLHSVAITSIDPGWHGRSLVSKCKKLLSASRDFGTVLFHLDLRLAVLYGVLQIFAKQRQCLTFQSFLCDVSRYSLSKRRITTIVRDVRSFIMNWMLVHTMDVIVVHTRAEVDLYSRFFRAPTSRFVFIPYFHYGDAVDHPTKGSQEDCFAESDEILAIGRHRDFDCFVRAVMETPWKAVIVAGDTDRDVLEGKVPSNVEVHYEVSRTEYRAFIAKASIVVIPLYSDRWQRALGQIAMFEAMLMRKPVVAAETFQLTDYASSNEVLFYRPGDANHLRQQISRLREDRNLRLVLIEKARRRLLTEFTRENFVAKLIASCMNGRNHLVRQNTIFENSHF